MPHFIILDLEAVPVSNAAEFISRDDIEAPSNYKDPKAIAAYVEKEYAKRAKAAALDLDLARVCVLGTCGIVDYTARVEQLNDEQDERESLEDLAATLADLRGDACLVTFNGHRYDLPLLMRRARYLGVTFPTLNLDRYHSPHIDLYDVLSMKGAVKAHGLRWYMRRLGYTDLLESDPLERGGGDVGDAVAAGQWDDVVAHCRADVLGTLRLAQWLGVVPQERTL